MKKNLGLVFFFVLVSACAMGTHPRKANLESCVIFFKRIHNPDKKIQREFYSKVEECRDLFKSSDELLGIVISSYGELFRVNPSHFHLEPFLPFYNINKDKTDLLIRKVLNEKDAREFYFRLKAALQENYGGNG